MADLAEGIAWPTGIYQLDTTDPVIGGPPNLATGNGKSNIPHLLLANRTQWLRRNMMAFNSTRSITGATVLDAADIGRLQVIVANSAITLPDATAVGAGATLHFVSTAGTSSTIAAAGADVIIGLATSPVTSAAIGLRGTLTLVSNGAGGWIATAGTVHQAGSFAFGASLTGNGYQRLPTGLILQWGTGTLPASGQPTASVNVTLPLAWPNGILSGSANAREFASSTLGAAPAMLVSFTSLTQITFLGDTLSTTPFNKTCPFFWQAVGF